ncbi:MAG: hypothetical protein HYX32_05775 [Actinobacteria bacterium]|nr:hypothetical protein [Actinomycetota bacterium]
MLDGLWNINGATAFVSQAGFASNKAYLNDPGLKTLAVETLKVMTEDQWNKGSPVLLNSINHDPHEALKRVMCAMGGPSIEQAVKDFRQESLITDFLSSRGKSNGLNCYDMLDVIGANGFNLYERLAGSFRTGAGREDFECVGVNILASAKFWNPHITDMVWESYSCRK